MNDLRLSWTLVPPAVDVFHVYHLRRAGGHGLIDWLLGHHAAEKVHYNQCVPQADSSVVTAKQWIRKYPGTAGQPPYQLASFEDIDISYLQKFYRPPASAVFLLRDPFNMRASRLQMFRNFPASQGIRVGAIVGVGPGLWKQYARAYLDSSVLPFAVRVSFNRWYVEPDYRRQLSTTLGWPFSDEGFGSRRGWEFSRGSSFGERDAGKLDVMNRWQKFRDDEDFVNGFDEETVELARQIFGFVPDLPFKHRQLKSASVSNVVPQIHTFTPPIQAVAPMPPSAERGPRQIVVSMFHRED